MNSVFFFPCSEDGVISKKVNMGGMETVDEFNKTELEAERAGANNRDALP